MEIAAGLVVIFIALKFGEATGGLEFRGWFGPVGTAIVCWVSGWLATPLLLQAFPEIPDPEKSHHILTLLQALGVQVLTTMIWILVAWAIVPGVRIRRFVGLFVASTLAVAFSYMTTVFIFKGQ